MNEWYYELPRPTHQTNKLRFDALLRTVSVSVWDLILKVIAWQTSNYRLNSNKLGRNSDWQMPWIDMRRTGVWDEKHVNRVEQNSACHLVWYEDYPAQHHALDDLRGISDTRHPCRNLCGLDETSWKYIKPDTYDWNNIVTALEISRTSRSWQWHRWASLPYYNQVSASRRVNHLWICTNVLPRDSCAPGGCKVAGMVFDGFG